MPSPNNNTSTRGGMGTYATTPDTNQVPTSNIDPAATVETGTVVDTSTAAAAPASPVSSLASGIGSFLLFPGQLVVGQFVGTGDPLDMSHLPVTILISAGAWYALYWYLTRNGGPLHSLVAK